jgi:hypothetical protein
MLLMAFLVAVIWLLQVALASDLPAPNVASASDASAWLVRAGPAGVVAVLARLVSLVLAWYFLASTGASWVLHTMRFESVAMILDRFVCDAGRRLARNAAGVSVAASALVMTTVATSAAAPSPVAVAAAADTVVTMRRLPPEHADRDAVTMRHLPPSAPVLPPDRAVVAPDTGVTTISVVPGDHLWGIAARTLKAAWGRPATDREIDPYWRAVVTRNRSQLADPDLIFPGQAIQVPTPPPSP